ncbi:MAG TPA: ADP-ribosylglycohydrolase family protein [Vineibacter sp.]|nr:ADP-ribosylglycohydrolase family protein [Vineibacter sp.]
MAATAVNPAADRAIGCLIGLAVGDALGTTLEFAPRDSYQHITDIVGGGPFRLAAGAWTDDTSMALCLAETLLAHRRVEPADLMERFRRWRDEGHNSVTGHCFDIGNTTRAAIDTYIATGNPLAGPTAARTAGNGSIMRLAPVPIFHAADVAAADAAAALQSRTTHAAAECVDGCRLMARVLVALLAGQSWHEAIAVDPALFATAKVQAIATGAWRGRHRDQIKSSGYVIDTLEAALWAVDSTADFKAAALLAVNLGDDADTVGAVAGQLAGARYGLAGIPESWRGILAWHDRLVDLAQALRQAR